MSWNVIRVLLIEDDLDFANLLPRILNETKPNLFEITHVGLLQHAAQNLEKFHYDVILLDLNLPDSNGIDSFTSLYVLASGVPIVILSASGDEGLALRCVRDGAQDYLSKIDLDAQALVRVLRYAIERERTLAKLKRQSLVDELTGLLNRRGFMSIAKQHLKIARRSGRKFIVFYVDVDDLKRVNDEYGHMEGDRALRSVAAILKHTFRSSDVIGRLGGDEFSVIAVDSEIGAEGILSRIQAGLANRNACNPQYMLSVSAGYVLYDATSEATLEELIAQADQAQYNKKKAKQDSYSSQA